MKMMGQKKKKRTLVEGKGHIYIHLEMANMVMPSTLPDVSSPFLT
jgi:hypothetical protein